MFIDVLCLFSGSKLLVKWSVLFGCNVGGGGKQQAMVQPVFRKL